MTTTDTLDVANRTAAVSVARDLTLLLARIGLGVLMVAHAKLEYDFAGSSIARVDFNNLSALVNNLGLVIAEPVDFMRNFIVASLPNDHPDQFSVA